MQCQYVTSRGPCNKPVLRGSNYCRTHSRNQDLVTAYRLADPDLTESVKHHAKASLYDVSQQIVLLRAMVERRLNMAGGSKAEQIAAYNFVATQLEKLTKMSETLLKLSKESGTLMERDKVMEFVDRIVQLVSEELSDLPDKEQRVDRIVSRISEEEDEDE